MLLLPIMRTIVVTTTVMRIIAPNGNDNCWQFNAGDDDGANEQ
jgi:hypothetical protein